MVEQRTENARVLGSIPSLATTFDKTRVPPRPRVFAARPNSMPSSQPNNPLHGITLEMIVTRLAEHYGWPELGRLVDIRCFNFDPGVKSSLVFLRKTPWARQKVEALYLRTFAPR